MDQHTPDALAGLQSAQQTADKANLALMLALDLAVSMGHIDRMPTAVLMALDYARECVAMMFRYLPTPGITSTQVHNAFEHAVAQAEAMVPPVLTVDAVAGPTQDQADLVTQYRAGFLSEEEFIELANEGQLKAWIVEKLS